MGLSPTGLHVVRELGRTGVPVVGVAETLQAGRLSRYLADCIVETDPTRRLEALCGRFRQGVAAKPVLIATSDQDIDFIIANAARLAAHFSFQRSYADGLAARIMTKESFYELCLQHGVAFPRLWKALPKDIAGLREAIAYPCMIKPSRIHDVKAKMAGRKGWIVRNPRELDAVLPGIPRDCGLLLLQEIVPGPESAITLYCGYFDANGGVHQPFTARKLRQYPPGFGSASLVQSAPEEESRLIAERLLRGIGYAGIAAAEFKRHPVTGELKMIEINVRPSLWFSVTAASGKHPVLAAYQDLAGLAECVPEEPQQDRVRWRYGPKDAWSAAFYRLRRGFVLPPPDVEAVGAANKRVSAVYASDDPKPVLADALTFATKIGRRLGGTHRAR